MGQLRDDPASSLPRRRCFALVVADDEGGASGSAGAGGSAQNGATPQGPNLVSGVLGAVRDVVDSVVGGVAGGIAGLDGGGAGRPSISPRVSTEPATRTVVVRVDPDVLVDPELILPEADSDSGLAEGQEGVDDGATAPIAIPPVTLPPALATNPLPTSSPLATSPPLASLPETPLSSSAGSPAEAVPALEPTTVPSLTPPVGVTNPRAAAPSEPAELPGTVTVPWELPAVDIPSEISWELPPSEIPSELPALDIPWGLPAVKTPWELPPLNYLWEIPLAVLWEIPVEILGEIVEIPSKILAELPWTSPGEFAWGTGNPAALDSMLDSLSRSSPPTAPQQLRFGPPQPLFEPVQRLDIPRQAPAAPPSVVVPLSAPVDVSEGTPRFRAGYGEFLRTAQLDELVVAAGPGVGGIAFLAVVGGVLGFRQARAGLAVRTSGAARFLR